eukprot:CAMPEP_0176373590 /NCGR_PEP_ID=MMETSP0126-20121128/26143_1 /TAXON_ID=141414 ORGANISM="Strombidinopsis acuminatum, Strain SPMC142" /NCGR_SAMPLE_ID=MMETSP0126 /ASSEMBLY_ACC=CAM_ASM_000229 /LENGTH=165 /DNA_ID=CAMNT_0017733785 /DNA_START=32 /DNA_END=529 /DNA_ORIENTATION=-
MISVLSAYALYSEDSPVVTLNQDNFRELVLNSDDLWLIDFYAPWCTACQEVIPDVETLAERFSSLLKVGAVDVDENTYWASQFHIKSMPSFFFLGYDKSDVPEELKGINHRQDLYHQTTDLIQKALKGKPKTDEEKQQDADYKEMGKAYKEEKSTNLTCTTSRQQ